MGNLKMTYEGDTPVIEDSELAAAVTRLNLGDLVVPQTHEAAPAALTVTAPAALTAAAVVTADAVSPANAAYTQDDQTALADLANSLKTQLNAVVADNVANRIRIAALVVDITALRTELATLVAALQASGILAAS